MVKSVATFVVCLLSLAESHLQGENQNHRWLWDKATISRNQDMSNNSNLPQQSTLATTVINDDTTKTDISKIVPVEELEYHFGTTKILTQTESILLTLQEIVTEGSSSNLTMRSYSSSGSTFTDAFLKSDTFFPLSTDVPTFQNDLKDDPESAVVVVEDDTLGINEVSPPTNVPSWQGETNDPSGSQMCPNSYSNVFHTQQEDYGMVLFCTTNSDCVTFVAIGSSSCCLYPQCICGNTNVQNGAQGQCFS